MNVRPERQVPNRWLPSGMSRRLKLQPYQGMLRLGLGWLPPNPQLNARRGVVYRGLYDQALTVDDDAVVSRGSTMRCRGGTWRGEGPSIFGPGLTRGSSQSCFHRTR